MRRTIFATGVNRIHQPGLIHLQGGDIMLGASPVDSIHTIDTVHGHFPDWKSSQMNGVADTG